MADKLHTQAELNALLAEQKRQHRTKLTELEQQLAAAQARVAELEPVAASYENLRGNVRRERVERELSAAFAKHRAYPQTYELAAREFARQAQVEHADDGAVTAVTLNGAKHATIDDAAKAFLATVPAFCLPPVGGSGSPRRGIGAPPMKAPEVDPIEQVRVGLSTPPKPLVTGPIVQRG